jgi:transitional endoplasmic reticulum ATPase
MIDAVRSLIYIDLVGGLTGSFTPSDIDDWSVGDVLLIPENGAPCKAEAGLWPTGEDVGTVKRLSDDGSSAIIEIDGKIRSFPQRELDPFKAGQTIKFDNTGAPDALLTNEPIDRFGLRGDTEFDIEGLIIQPGEIHTTLEDFGGSPELVRRAVDLVSVALDPQQRVQAIGANPIKGILFSGPAGTGKTHLARVLCGMSNANFYNISGPAIIDQYVGQSERRLRDIFTHAEANGPAILFFDEVDSLTTHRGIDTPEYASRLVGQFLATLDGFKANRRVLVIATTNLPGTLDDALLRPGRLGHKLVFTLPDENSRLAILRASARNLRFSEEVDLVNLAARTAQWNASELSAIWTESAILAALDQRDMLCAEDVAAAVPRVQRVSANRTGPTQGSGSR